MHIYLVRVHVVIVNTTKYIYVVRVHFVTVNTTKYIYVVRVHFVTVNTTMMVLESFVKVIRIIKTASKMMISYLALCYVMFMILVLFCFVLLIKHTCLE